MLCGRCHCKSNIAKLIMHLHIKKNCQLFLVLFASSYFVRHFVRGHLNFLIQAMRHEIARSGMLSNSIYIMPFWNKLTIHLPNICKVSDSVLKKQILNEYFCAKLVISFRKLLKKWWRTGNNFFYLIITDHKLDW